MNMSDIRTTIRLLLIGFLFTPWLSAQSTELPFAGFEPALPADSGMRICFYNVENLFDTEDDTLKWDEEFLPEGKKKWDDYKYWDKQKKIAETLLAIGYAHPPALIGLCEVENRRVLNDLVRQDIMKAADYRVIHFESPDRRGIDVGLLMDRSQLKLLSASFVRLERAENPDWRTRDILYAKLAGIHWADTFHVWVNHWPSRRGGEEASRPLRVLAATALRAQMDSVQRIHPGHGLIIMGDLNDGVGDASLTEGLRVSDWNGSTEASSAALYDLMQPLDVHSGTHKYRGEWNYLDHLVVNGGLLDEQGATKLRSGGGENEWAKVFRADWLLQPDDRYTGRYPLRSFSGPRYLGGYSDHLPIYLDLVPAHQ